MGAALRRLDVFSARPFGSASFGERDALAFAEIVEVGVDHTGGVEKQILASARVDEPKTFVGDPFDRAFCHFSTFVNEASHSIA